ncbi:MAG: type II secretion system F family protein [Nitrospiraceae bacterium]|nr:MAG: type II secretion system F family protein [Nitrospiraceae bacterium]
MPVVFQWSGKNPQGNVQKGELTANTKDEVIAHLRKQKIVPTIVTPKQKAKKSLIRSRVSDKDLVVFTRQFATMIDAGLPLVQALEILAKQTENKHLANVIGEVKIDVEGGSTYADALRKHPRVFSDLYTNMVAAGESGGILDTILNRLAVYIEKAMKLKSKVKGAMIYPSVIVSVAIIVVWIILAKVVPTFATMFARMGGILPLPTRIVVALSNFLAGPGGLAIIMSIIGLIIFIVMIRRTEKGKYTIDSILLKLPIFGILLKKVAVSKFTRTLGTLIGSGVPILEGLDITAKTAGNKVVEYEVQKVRQAVSEGRTIAEPLTDSKVFPVMVTQMIAVGESTGAIDTMLNKIADFYDDEVDQAVSNLTAMLEPVIMVFLGATIGFIVIAMYMPIFKLITLIK